MIALICFKNWPKYCNKTSKQQTTIFLPKINKVFLGPILQNLNGKSVLDNFIFENDSLDEPKKMPPSKKFSFFRKLVNKYHNQLCVYILVFRHNGRNITVLLIKAVIRLAPTPAVGN